MVETPVEPDLELPSHSGLEKRRGGGGGGGRGGGGGSRGGGGRGGRSGSSTPPSYRYLFLPSSERKIKPLIKIVLPQTLAAKQLKDPEPREPTPAPAIQSTTEAALPFHSPLSRNRQEE